VLNYCNATLAGLPVGLLNRLQTVLINASVRSVAGLRRSVHITDTVASLRWLRVPQRTKFKQAVVVYRALRGIAPRYLSDMHCVRSLLHRQEVVSGRRVQVVLTFAWHVLHVSVLVRFATAGHRAWNSLPDNVTCASSLPAFRPKLKAHLF